MDDTITCENCKGFGRRFNEKNILKRCPVCLGYGRRELTWTERIIYGRPYDENWRDKN